MTFIFFVWFYILLIVSVGCTLVYEIIRKKRKIDSMDLIFISLLVVIQAIWFPWTYNTVNIDSEYYAHASQASCIIEGEKGIERSGGICENEMFLGDHELTYPLFLIGAREIFGDELGERILVNILNIFTTLFIYLILRQFSKNRILCFTFSLLYYLIPFKNVYILEYFAENLLFFLSFGLLLYIVESKEDDKEKSKKLPLFLVLLSWLLIFTRIELIFVVPLLISIYLSKNKIKISLRDYLLNGAISAFFLLILFSFSNIRTKGMIGINFFPVMLLSLFVADFIVNRLFKNKDYIREFVFYALYFGGIIFFLLNGYHDNHYSISQYGYRLSNFWIPELFKTLLNSNIIFKLVIFGGLGFLIYETFLYFSNAKRRKMKNRDSFFISIALILVSFQIFITYSFLEPLNIDFRFIITSLSFFFIPIGIVWVDFFSLNSKGYIKIIKIVISLLLCIATIFFLFQIQHQEGNGELIEDAAEECPDDSFVLFYSAGGIHSLIAETNVSILPLSFTISDQEEAKEVLEQYNNICWLRKKRIGEDVPSKQKEFLSTLENWLIERSNGEKIYENEVFDVFYMKEVLV
ncbi:MAG: hypothetical protein PWQ28_504 [Candidatus Woesearchaeota archaeon]|nr:hypothetical protein [Candidatus Woesearchaeota archaeon]